MTAQIANILKTLLATIDNGLDAQSQPLPQGLLFVDKLAGLVAIGEKVQPTDVEGAFKVSKFPISLDSNYEECISSGCYKDLVPNSNLKGILYFEDNGTTPGPVKHDSYQYTSKLRLVCWINNNKIHSSGCLSINHVLITLIRATLEKGHFNSGVFKKIIVRTTSIIENEPRLFSRYNYPMESVKFLMHPYEAFGLDLTVDYSIGKSCISDLQINPVQC
ncbi:hypothetical protein [Gaetbulibacter sp. PBL-D1]|uniref:hypothetical protein n=1 Tax=Gaetbulibacter sp. PBL-D1 TaxID=3422594 RepID=UPI003D2EFEA2